MPLPIETENPLFGKYLYPEAKEIMEKQQDVFWTAQEIDVAADIHDYRANMTESQYNLVTTTLQVFVETEQVVGDIWNTIATWFPHSEIDGACTQIASMEKSVHAFFYQKMSDVLNIDPETIAENQQQIAVLRNKLDLLHTIMADVNRNKQATLFSVAMIEQVLLFSNFAMLKSFQANGYSLIPNTITGVKFVIQDESLHGVFASYLYNTYTEEAGTPLNSQVTIDIVEEIIAHEDGIIDYLFRTNDSINSITATQIKAFIRERANTVLTDMNFEPLYEVEDTTISEWFFKGTNAISLHDFFVSGTNQYRRNWSIDKLSALPYIGVDNE